MDCIEFFKGKKVFITGHTGFKGGWLMKMLSLCGAKVKGFALPPATIPSLFEVLAIRECGESVLGDIMEADVLENEILAFRPDFVFHLAAQPIVRLSYDIPAETFAVNAIGTAHVLDAIRKLEKPCIAVMITTDKVYQNKEWNYPYRENDRLGGYDPYSASKACAELVIDSYRNSFFHPDLYRQHRKAVLVARAGNVIGGGDWAADRLIPDIVRALSTGKELILRNPAAIRPWQHVTEPLYGYLLLAMKASECYPCMPFEYNFGPDTGDTLTVEEMTKTAIRIWQAGKYRVEGDNRGKHEAGLLKLDISLAKTVLGWKPALLASEAVEWTIEWYKKYYAKDPTLTEYMEHQIQDYLKKQSYVTR